MGPIGAKTGVRSRNIPVMTATHLTIAEEFLLLSLREQDGKPLIGNTEATAALSGALLTDLVIARRVDLADDHIRCVNRSPVGHPELDAVLARIAAETKPRKVQWWVAKLRSDQTRKRILGGLAHRGVLRVETVKVFGIFPTTRFPQQNPEAERLVLARLYAAIGGARPDERTACLFALVHACKLDGKLFPNVGKVLLDHRAAEMAEGEWAAAAVRKVIAQIQSATAAVIATTAAATATTGG